MELEPTPEILPMFPEELKERTQWCNYTYEGDNKVPINPRTGGHAMVNQPSTWNTFEAAIERGAKYNLGLGFVLTESDPYTCIDLDDCLGKGGVKTEPAISIVELFKGNAYIEASPSRTGVHIWTRNLIPVNRRTSSLEIYSSGRWMTVSGYVNPQAPRIEVIPDGTELVQEVLRRFLTKEPLKTNYSASETPTDDAVIWDKLFHWRNGDVLEKLYRGDRSGIRSDDNSYADTYLANALAWAVGDDPERIKRLMHQTGMVRDKWFEKRGHKTWLDLVVENSILWASGRKK